MKIIKTENSELCERQWAYFDRVRDFTYTRISPVSYEYEYVPGVQAVDISQVFEYLFTRVWCHRALSTDSANYETYIRSLIDEYKIAMPNDSWLETLSMISLANEPQNLVHGDATMENFIYTGTRVIGIDPGLPRGFNSRENDIGKLLQSTLTKWEYIRHGVEIRYTYLESLPVTTLSIASLLSHWIRIVKNAVRHTDVVERYGREIVIPILSEELQSALRYRPVRYRWGVGRLRLLQHTFIQASTDALRRVTEL